MARPNSLRSFSSVWEGGWLVHSLHSAFGTGTSLVNSVTCCRERYPPRRQAP